MEPESFQVWQFVGNDAAYRQWLESHPSGFVINTDAQHSPAYMVLHRATCKFISNFQSHKPGAFTERGFVKICAVRIEDLRKWVKLHGRPDGSFSSECGICKPAEAQGVKPAEPRLTRYAPPQIPTSVKPNAPLPDFSVLSITPAEYGKIVAKCRSLPPAKGNYLITDYVENVLLTVLDFQLQTSTVQKAAQHYLKHAKSKVNSFQSLKDLLARYPDTRAGDSQVALYLWGYDYWNRVRLLRPFLTYLETQGVTTQDTLKAWAERTSFDEFRGQVKGMGIGIFQWLVMRQGVETVKPDIWVHRFVKEATGRELSDTDVVAVLEAAARELRLKAYELDWRIWEHQRESGVSLNTGRPYGDEITLTEEEDTSLDRVWERLRSEGAQRKPS